MMTTIVLIAGCALIGAIVGYLAHYLWSQRQVASARQRARQIIEEAHREAQGIVREGKLEVRDELHRLRAEFEASTKEQRLELQKEQQWLEQKKQSLDKRLDVIEQKEQALLEEREKLARERQALDAERARIAKLVEEEEQALQRVAGLSREEATQRLMTKLEREVEYEAATLIRRKQQEALEEADRHARDIIAQAVQRCASEHVAETTVCSVSLPSDDMKGRIIGREGRNIRALEQETGVEILIDDTPNAVVISGFDPVRREIARRTLERLIADGRIHPARIEEVLAKVRREMDREIEETGTQAALELGITGLHPELVKLVGRLKFRTSYGQNLLHHSLEVARIMASLCAELHEDITKGKRIGLLHDIGKAVDHEVEGAHAAIGADLARRYNEPRDIINAIAAHHNEVAPENRLAVLTSAADAISAARPGARSESYELYLQRIEQLEKAALEINGVQSAFAIQAGRELRVLVDADTVDDNQTLVIARQIAKRVSDEVQFPGQIRVTVVREKRVIEYAR
ncbi:MAG: ribonuclease Y [bacterium]|nr:ribonuclease Y [bacterium]